MTIKLTSLKSFSIKKPTDSTVQADVVEADEAASSVKAGLLTRVVGLLGTLGEVQASPTANTVLDRLKTIASALTNSGGSLIGVSPQLSSGGNASAQTNATGTNFTVLGSQACKQLTVVNNTGTTIEVQQGGSGVALPIQDQDRYTFYGLSNANQLGIRRVDQSNTQVTVAYRWEG
jgi:hypothetical protein